MPKEPTKAKESSVSPLNAQRRSAPRQNALTRAGFTGGNGTYERDFGDGVSITLKESISSSGEKSYRSSISNGDYGRVGSLTESEVRRMTKKLSGMSPSDARKAVDSYIKDLFNPRKTQSEGDALRHRKKYLGF